jgi:hypothetical protein
MQHQCTHCVNGFTPNYWDDGCPGFTCPYCGGHGWIDVDYEGHLYNGTSLELGSGRLEPPNDGYYLKFHDDRPPSMKRS